MRTATPLLLTAMLSLPLELWAQQQNIPFAHLSLEDGLSQTSVNAVLQDHLGFLWFGTEDGLNRYDGRDFIIFKHDPEDPSSLGQNWVWAIFEDRQGRLWVGSENGGLSRWNPNDGTFFTYRNHPQDPESLSHNRVRTLLEDREGMLWIGTDGGGINLFDPSTEKFQRFSHNPSNPNSLSNDRVLAMHVDRKGILWIGTHAGGLNRFDPDTRSFIAYRADPEDPHSLGADEVRAIYEDRDGVLWIGTINGGLSRFEPESETFVSFRNDPSDLSSLSSDRVRAVFQDSTGTLWVGTDDGLNSWQPESETFVRYRPDPANPRSLNDHRVRSIYQDRGGVLWIGHQQGGLSRWNPLTGFFPHISKDPSSESGLSSNSISSFAVDQSGLVWIGTFGGGLNRLDRTSGEFTHFRHDPADTRSLSNDGVMSLLIDSRNVLWVGTYRGGLNRFNRASETFTHYVQEPTDFRSISANGVMSLLEDRQGVIWVGTYGGGLDRFDRDSGSFIHYRHDPSVPTTLAGTRVAALCEDSSGALWVGTEAGGLNRFDRHSGTFTHYRHDPGDTASISSDLIVSIHEDPQGVLWIGTRGGGLNRWNREDRDAHRGVFKRYTQRDGLPNDSIWGILSDDEGDLWLSTNRGISKLDPATETFKNYNPTHGLQSHEFNFGAHYRSPSGEMFFGGVNGFNAFLPAEIRDNAHPPPVLLTALLKANQEVRLDKPIWETDEIELSYRDYVVSLEFAALDFTAPEQNRYAYKLEGFHEDWIQLGALRRATFTNLDARRYLFRVKASNNDGLWNEQGAVLNIRVIPPPWETWWAYTLYAAIVGGLIIGYIRSQARKLKREEEYSRKLELEVRERTRELEEASLTDPLTGLRNRRYLMTHINEDLALVDRYYSKHPHPVEGDGDDNRDFLFLMVDLDGLKMINDIHGHAAGDAAIIQMRDLLQKACRKSDTLIRLGGDEFLVVGRDVSRQAAETVAERIRDTVHQQPLELSEGKKLELSCSVGFAFYPFLLSEPTSITGDQVVTIADRALYVAKSSGRNAWVGIHSTSRTAPDALMEMINYRLQPLIEQGAIDLSASLPIEKLFFEVKDSGGARGATFGA